MFQRISKNDGEMKVGISLKRTKFFSRELFLSTIVELSRWCEYIIVDYEGETNLLTPSEVDSLLQAMHGYLVLTIAVRGNEFYQNEYLFEAYLDVARKRNNLRFCFVPGHPAYQSVNKSIPLKNAMLQFIETTRDVQSSEIFIGVENVPFKTIQWILTRHDSLIPFLLNGDHRLPVMTNFFDNVAVYSPFTTNLDLDHVGERLRGYLFRRRHTWKLLEENGIKETSIQTRKWSQLSSEVKNILLMALDHFALTPFNIDQRVAEFLQHRITHLILHPISTDSLVSHDKKAKA